MKKFLFCLLTTILLSEHSKAQFQTLHDFSPVTILGDTLDLSTLYGKKVLVVNTASFCGYTYEYALLQELYDLYGGENFEILGFPSDDFNQEPEDDSTIYDFCINVYGITFQMMSKVHVKGAQICDVYDWLTHESQNGVANAPVLWNFQKFAIDELGHWVTWYPHQMNPLDTSIVNWILSPSVVETSVETPAADENHLKIYQQESLVVEFNSNHEGELIFLLHDLAGKKILSQNLRVKKGLSRFNLNQPVPGVYFVSALINDRTVTQKIVVR